MILVTGATGFIGRHVVTRLMAEGYRVRCLIPEHKQITWAEQPQQPEIIQGNVLDEEVLFRAVTGVHAIIHLESAQWWGRLRDLERVELVGTRNLVAAARAARVGRIMTISHLGAAPSSAYPLLRIKGMVEEVIRSSGLAYTIIRSGLVFGEDDAFINHIALSLRVNPLFFLMPGRGEVVLHPIYIDDLVNAIINCLDNIDTVDTLMEIGGPEYITLEDLIRTVMRVSGMQRVVVPVPPYMLRWTTALYSRVLPRALMTPQWLDILATNRTAQLANTFTYFGIRPRRLEDTLLTYMRGRGYWLLLMRSTFRRRPRGV
jgi:NADH dehydrogenase